MSIKDPRAWYKGWISFWVKDTGVASYFIPALFASLLSPLLVALDPIALNMATLFSIVCMYSALAQQSIKMQATEWQSLVVGYQEHVMQQGKIILLLINILMMCNILFIQNVHLAATLGMANALGISLWFLCRVYSHLFTTACYITFTLAILLIIVCEQTPLFFAPTGFVICLTLLLFNKKLGLAYAFKHDALANYLNGVQSGWSPLPDKLPLTNLAHLNKFLFPLSYFVGPALSQYLILLLFISAAALGVNQFYDVSEHALFILCNIILALFMFFHWSKAQRTKSWELLYTLPIYNSIAQAKLALAYSTYKVTILLAVLCFVFCLLINSEPAWQWLLALKFSLVISAGVLASFVIANLSKNSNVIGIYLCLWYGAQMAITVKVVEAKSESTTLLFSVVYLLVTLLLHRYTIAFVNTKH
ncbi:ABC transporter permease [Pseudoalteromonas sp. MMG010]|uniref:ABC transporter permease n=1 Tax=Pseudoalteromonas sp. MMG010 TaxID=2822685 RepID=UPI001B39DC2C|nr:ABC transporter permease [Pseudoalteromonas sp. MMG010]MBQ4832038.1 ABC transporter permease [Pseudoalteromonas sp. MMG010]